MRLVRILAALLVSLAATAASAQTNVTGLDFTDNNAMAVSAATHFRLRYNTTTGRLESSTNGAAYVTMPTSLGTLATTYSNGTGQASSTMTLDATRLGIIVKDANSTVGSLLTVQNNGATANYLLIAGNATQVITSGQADGVGNVGTRIDTTSTFTNGKMLQIMSNASERYSWQLSQMNFPANMTFAVLGSASTNTTAVTFTTNVADGATSIAYRINNSTTLTSTAKLLSVANNGTEKLNLQTGALNLASAVNLVSAGGAANFDFSASSGTFLTPTGTHTFGGATWNVPANLTVTGGSSATNTTAVALTTNVADGASSIMVDLNNSATLSTAGVKYVRLRNNGTLAMTLAPFGGDGVRFADGGGSSSLNLSTSQPASLNYGFSSATVGIGTVLLTDNTGTIQLNGGTVTCTVFSINPDADGTRTIGTSSIRWGNIFSVIATVKAATSQTAATQSWSDSAGKAHFGTDSAGFPSLGSYYEWREIWGMNQTLSASQTNAVFTGGLWKYTSSANATGFTCTTGMATGSPIGSCLSMGSGTANTNSTIVTSIASIFNPAELTNLYAIAEFPMVLSAVGANNFTAKVGLANAAISGTHPAGYYFQKASTDTNWQCLTDDGTTTSTTNSSTAPSAGTIQIGRIEYYGSGSVLGAKTVKFYINNSLVCTNTNNVYAGNVVFFQAYITATSAITQQTLGLGPVLLMYNEVATPLIP